MGRGLMLIFALVLGATAATDAKCFEGVFVFGDSNSDTGGFYAAFPPLNPPNGITYFGKPSGRLSDGRLIIDFLAQAVGLPFVSPYLQSMASDFRNGANFAVVAAAVKTVSVSVFPLSTQLNQFRHLKFQVETQHNNSGTPLPGPDVFGKSLYTVYIGQNDFAGNKVPFGAPERLEFMRQVAYQIADTTKEIYSMGGRAMLVFNMAPLGCYPYILAQFANSSSPDASGCHVSCNADVEAYNAALKAALDQTRQQLPFDAKLILVDLHAVLRRIFTNPASYGFEKSTIACSSDGKSFCNDPEKYVSWDGVHLTEAANKVVAGALIGGSYFDPPFPISEFCDIPPSH